MTVFLDRLTDSELDDMVKTVRTLREVIQAIALAQDWSYLSVEQRAELWVGAEGQDALPALRRTFLLLEER